ncbi:MAG: DUF4058 family protein [Planctomycetaceae bacterium]
MTRYVAGQELVYAIQLRQRLPRIAIPLDETDVTLDLQAAFERCWDEGPYPELLHYDGNPPGELSHDDTTWARETAAKYNPAEPAN